MTNKELEANVREEILSHPLFKNSSDVLKVSVNDGVITLTGLVDSYSKKQEAESLAQRVAGVRVVASDLEVRFKSSGRFTDTEVAIAIKNALRWHSQVDEDKIKVKVDDGWVYLDGAVEYTYQRSAAERAVVNLNGVRGISNRLKVAGKIDKRAVLKKITTAFHRAAQFDVDTINVEIRDGRATLTGKVRSWPERREAENIVLSSDGIDSVDNRIEVVVPMPSM
ncbi:MAG TPA: BON domain-containing protein [Cyclobacteriaceae bacterium]|nr:BON domain-containing protein [Cyclobacteriaceae bacterium]